MQQRVAHRRGFKVVLALGLSMIAANGNARGGDATAPTTPLLGCRLASYGEYQEDGWSHLPTLGVHYVYLSVPAPGEVASLRKKLQEHHLEVLVLGGHSNLSLPGYIEEIRPQLAACRELGARHLFLSPKHENLDRDTAYSRLRNLGELAKEHEIVIVLETHPDLGTNGDVQLETMRKVNHPNVRVNFDTGNITFYNHGADAAAELAKIIDYVATVEFKDHGGGYKSWDFPPLGQGRTNFAGVFEILRKHNFQGPMTIEVEGVTGKVLDREQTKQAIAESVVFARKLVGSP